MLIAITGPAGSGKTTVSSELVKGFSKGVHIDMDTVKHFVCTGFKYDETTEGIEQWKLLGKNTSALINNFLQDNYDVVVNGCVHEVTWLEIAEHATLDFKVLLFPDEQTNVRRDFQRPKDIAMGRLAVLSHREMFETDKFYDDWLKYDSSDDSLEKSVQYMQALVDAKNL